MSSTVVQRPHRDQSEERKMETGRIVQADLLEWDTAALPIPDLAGRNRKDAPGPAPSNLLCKSSG